MASAYELEFKALSKRVGGALVQLGVRPTRIHGRDSEISLLYAILERPVTPVAILLGQAGVGKTALVEEFARQLNTGEYKTELGYKYRLVALRLGVLSALGASKLQTCLATLLDDLKHLEETLQSCEGGNYRIVLFIDEIHMLVTMFGPGTKIGGDVMKDILARSPIRVITATTRLEYDSTIAVDKPLSERFKQIEMGELDAGIVENILSEWWTVFAPGAPPLDPRVLQLVLTANRLYRSDSAEPRKSIDILEDLVSAWKRTGVQPTVGDVSRIFRQRYSINLQFSVDPSDVEAVIDRRVKGQPHARFELKRLIRSMILLFDQSSNRPMATALFTGPTGVGKTETVKSIAEGLYPGERVLLNLNMPDYKLVEHEPKFRRDLGEFVRHTPNAIILLDEVEKGSESVLDSLLAILDEGLVVFNVENREGRVERHSASLRNAIVIATTNAGSDVFDNDAKFSQRESNQHGNTVATQAAELEQLLRALRGNLISNGFKPELLGRFDRIIPYRSLDSLTLLQIAQNKLDAMYSKFLDRNGIRVIQSEPRLWPQDSVGDIPLSRDVAVYLTFVKAQATDSRQGGARSIQRFVDSIVKPAIVDAVVDNPGCKTFRVYISEDSSLFNYGVAASTGGVVVEPA